MSMTDDEEYEDFYTPQMDEQLTPEYKNLYEDVPDYESDYESEPEYHQLDLEEEIPRSVKKGKQSIDEDQYNIQNPYKSSPNYSAFERSKIYEDDIEEIRRGLGLTYESRDRSIPRLLSEYRKGKRNILMDNQLQEEDDEEEELIDYGGEEYEEKKLFDYGEAPYDLDRKRELKELISKEKDIYNRLKNILNDFYKKYQEAKMQEIENRKKYKDDDDGDVGKLTKEYKEDMKMKIDNISNLLGDTRDRFEEYMEEYTSLGGNRIDIAEDITYATLSYKKSNLENHIDDLIKHKQRLDRRIEHINYMLNDDNIRRKLSKKEISKLRKMKSELNRSLINNKKKYQSKLKELKKEKELKEKIKSVVFIPVIRLNNEFHEGRILHPSMRDEYGKVIEDYIKNNVINDLKSITKTRYVTVDPENYDLAVVDPNSNLKYYDRELTLKENDIEQGIYRLFFDYDLTGNFLKAIENYMKNIKKKREKIVDPRKVAFKNVELTIQSEAGDKFLTREKNIVVSRNETIKEAVEKHFFDRLDSVINLPYRTIILNKNKNVVRQNIDLYKSFFENDLFDDSYTIVISYNPLQYEKKKKEIEQLNLIDEQLPKTIIITDDTTDEEETYTVKSIDIVVDIINRYINENPVDSPIRLVEFFEGKRDNKRDHIIVDDLNKSYIDNKLYGNVYFIKLYYFIDYEQELKIAIANEENEKVSEYIYTVNLDTIILDVMVDYLYKKVDFPEEVEMNNFNFEVRDKKGNVITIDDVQGTMADNQLFFKEYFITFFPDYNMIKNLLELSKGLENVNLSGLESIEEDDDDEPQIEMVSEDDEQFDEDLILF